MNSIYEEIGRRTDGNIYLAVVGPVRTGKSTFVKRFMERMVIPSIDNVYHRERARDELPQSAAAGPFPPRSQNSSLNRRWKYPRMGKPLCGSVSLTL